MRKASQTKTSPTQTVIMLSRSFFVVASSTVVIVLLLASSALGFPSAPAWPNNRPVIGVLTQPAPDELSAFGSAYIAASYVKFAESSSAQVVPIFYNGTTEYLQSMFTQVNGLIFPGGGSDIGPGSQLYTAAQTLYNLALQANDQGDYFPIAGHCLGYEILAQLISGNDFEILSNVNSENISLPLTFTSAAPTSRLFGAHNCPPEIYDIFHKQNVTLNNHEWAVTPSDFAAKMASKAVALSTNFDRDGKQFVSTFEMIDYPIWGLQWHAEKPLFEWNIDEAINHSVDAVSANSYISRFTGTQVRNSKHSFPTQADLTAQVIYNYCPMYTEALTGDFEQCYLFGSPTNATGTPTE